MKRGKKLVKFVFARRTPSSQTRRMNARERIHTSEYSEHLLAHVNLRTTPRPKRPWKFIKIPKVFDDCLLFFAQNPDQIPFAIKRIYFITNADTKLPRGFHAHKKNRQIFFCIQGSIKLILDNGQKREAAVLDNPQKGVEIPEMTWHEMHNFKKNTILLVIASEKFDARDYIRNYRLFIKLAAKK